jgi:HPt (histidine-containing phosphotransfer) domain-containing protein
MQKLQIINQEKFYDYSGDTHESHKAMAQLFIDQSHIYVQELSFAMDENSHDLWHDVAHKYKGMTSFVGADALYHACHHAQEIFESSKKDKQKALNSIQEETNRAIQELSNILRTELI